MLILHRFLFLFDLGIIHFIQIRWSWLAVRVYLRHIRGAIRRELWSKKSQILVECA